MSCLVIKMVLYCALNGITAVAEWSMAQWRVRGPVGYITVPSTYYTSLQKSSNIAYYINFSFEKQQDNRTKGHNLKLVSHRRHYDLRKYSFTTRIVVTWNSLPESVIAAETTDCFNF